jgi:predicted dehydrogenase
MQKFRWGILSTAGIARKNWRAIRDSGNSVVAAVASRDAARSRKFIDDCQQDAPADWKPAALGSYEELIQSDEVDGIYVPLPTGLRKEWVLRAAHAGKHVVCEKPCGVSLADVRDMVNACQKNNVQFMDGVMFMHNPRLARIRQILDDGKTVGPIKRMMSVFSFMAGGNFFDTGIRVNADLEPAGCLGDLGWYNIRFALCAKNWELPTQVTGRTVSSRGTRINPKGAPTDFSAELFFADGSSMGFFCSFLAHYQNWVHVGGAAGYLRLADFVHPASVHEPAIEYNGTVEQVKCCDCAKEHSDSKVSAQDSRMWRNFANQAASGKLNPDWPMWALKTQEVLDACYSSAQQGSRTISLA